MPFLQNIIAQLVDNAHHQDADHPVDNLFGALFRGPADPGDQATGIGGLAGLVSRFERAGLGGIIHSWTGAGPILPATPEQLRAVLGVDAAKAIAAASEREGSDIMAELALLLPGVVHRMTHPGER